MSAKDNERRLKLEEQQKAKIEVSLRGHAQDNEPQKYAAIVNRNLLFLFGHFEWYVKLRIQLMAEYPSFFEEYDKKKELLKEVIESE